MTASPRTALVLSVLLCGCAGAVPDPARMAAELPPFREVTAERRAGLDIDVERARTELSAGHVSEARGIVDRVLEYDPRHARARAILGQCHLLAASETIPPRLEEFRLAEGELRRATALAPEDPFIARLHAGFLVADGHLSAAAERIERGLSFAPDDLDLLELGGRVNFDLGNERAAIPLLAARSERVPTDRDSVWRLAQCHARLCVGATDAAERSAHATGAVAAFQSYALLAPDDVDGLLGEAWARLQSIPADAPPSEFEVVVETYDRAARLHPESAEARFGRALAFGRAGRLPEMRDALRETLALDPSHAGALIELGADAAENHLIDDARVWFERALGLELSGAERRKVTAWLAANPVQTKLP